MKGGLGLVLTAALCLILSLPSGLLPVLAGLLVLPGLMAFYALAESRRRPLLQAYVVGFCAMLGISFSVRHILQTEQAYIGWVLVLAISLLGGLYYVLVIHWTRVLARWLPGPAAFGLGLALSCWLRAHMPEINYPHGQPAQCLHAWPWLLGPARWGGELLVNLLLGTLAAALVDLYRSWRLARPAWGRSLWVLGMTGLLCSGLSLVSPFPATEVGEGADKELRILAIEPRLLSAFQVGPDYEARVAERVLPPTSRLAGPEVEDPVDLVLWPESASLHCLDGKLDPERPRLLWWQGRPVRLAPGCRLLAGTVMREPEGRLKVVALLTDHQGRYVAHQEKRRLAPGGEHTPFLGWLPAGLERWLRRVFQENMGIPLPEVTPGSARPPLELADGTPFGAMICFDNAFPEVARELVQDGARFLVVLSNEAWYRGGAELWQMQAMTVLRALETGVPIIRCTVDGATLAVGAEGQILARLEVPAPDHAQAALMEVRLALPSGAARPLPWLGRVLLWLVLLSSVPVLGQGLGSWGRLVRTRSLAA